MSASANQELVEALKQRYGYRSYEMIPTGEFDSDGWERSTPGPTQYSFAHHPLIESAMAALSAGQATEPVAERGSPCGNDADWVLAMAGALGTDSGILVPIVPSREGFRQLFDEVRRRAAGQVIPEPPAGVEKIMALVDDYTDHFVEVASQKIPFVADVVVLKAKKNGIRTALAGLARVEIRP